MCVFIQKTDDDSTNAASDTQDSGLGILPINAEDAEAEEPDSSDPVIDDAKPDTPPDPVIDDAKPGIPPDPVIGDAKPEIPPDTVAEEEKPETLPNPVVDGVKPENPPKPVTEDEKTEEPAPADTVAADPHAGILKAGGGVFWIEMVEVPQVGSASSVTVQVYTDGTAQINVGKVDIYMRGKVAQGEDMDATRERIEELQKQIKPKRKVECELQQCEEQLQKIIAHIRKMSEQEQQIRQWISEQETMDSPDEEADSYLERLRMRLQKTSQQVVDAIEKRRRLEARIEELNGTMHKIEEVEKELDQLRGKLHNYQRSRDMNAQLETAGISDNDEMNAAIVKNLLRAARRISGDKITEQGIGVQSELSITRKVIILESKWRVYEDKDGEIKKYMTTVILKKPKE